MAIGYQLLGKPVEGLDTSVFTTLSANLLAQEKERETQRQAWKTEQDALRKTQRDITATANQDANQFFGKFSQGIIDQSLDLQNQLETGQIRSSDYTAQWSNLNQSNEQMISAQKGYQEKAQKVVESVANQTASVGLAHNFAEFNKRFQPGKMSVEKDERGGLRLYNLETGQEVSPSYLNDLVNTELPKFDYTTAATTLVDSFGKRAFTAADGSFISGAIFNPGDTYSAVLSSLNPKDIEKLMKTEAESILAGSQAPTVSILLDGKGYETVYNRSELKKGENIYRKPDGTYEFADGDEEVALDFMAEQLRNALPMEIKKTKKIIPDPKSPTQIEADNKSILSYGIAYEVVLGGPNGEATKNQIVVNNKEIRNIYENNDAFVIQYDDPQIEDAIVVKIKDAEGNYNLEDTAVSLYESVNPKGTVTDARTARENYFKRNEKGIKSEDETLLGEREAFTPLNSTQVQTTRQTRAKSTIYISDEIDKITPDGDQVSKVNTIIKDIRPLPGTQQIMNQIKVSSVDVGPFSGKDELIIEIPSELLPFVKDLTGVKYDAGNKISFDYDDKKDNVTLTSVVDGILEGMYDIYNKTNTSSKPKKKTKPKKETRSITEIMEEDGVSYSEALKIFNAK
tara:strand:+ start:2094 stop:3974 length:1881 start_codon:yes stop_codon:yes gene_type:complete